MGVCESKGNRSSSCMNIRSGKIHKMTLVVRDPNESKNFCVEVLGCQEIPVPDPNLNKRGIKWVRLPGHNNSFTNMNAELHFIPLAESTREQQELWTKMKMAIDAQDHDMQVWSCGMNTHVGFSVDDLSPIVAKLQARKYPFFGPTKRADNVYQLYVELPWHHYIEIDAMKYDESLKRAATWLEVKKNCGVDLQDYAGEDISQTERAARQGDRPTWANPDSNLPAGANLEKQGLLTKPNYQQQPTQTTAPMHSPVMPKPMPSYSKPIQYHRPVQPNNNNNWVVYG